MLILFFVVSDGEKAKAARTSAFAPFSVGVRQCPGKSIFFPSSDAT